MASEETSLIVPAETLGGERVVDANGDHVGSIDDLVIDARGAIVYAVMTTARERGRVSVPWAALCRDESRGCFVLEAGAP